MPLLYSSAEEEEMVAPDGGDVVSPLLGASEDVVPSTRHSLVFEDDGTCRRRSRDSWEFALSSTTLPDGVRS